MRRGLRGVVAPVTVAVILAGAWGVVQGQTQAPAAGGGAAARPAATAQGAQGAKTPWGEPDLQGIWTDETTTPLQRNPRFAGREFFTDAEVAAFDKQRAGILRQDHREPKGSERDVSGAYNAVFVSVKKTGRRTSLVVDPPDGRIPPLTAAAEARNKAHRDYRMALLQSTETCRKKEPACAGWAYAPPSPRRNEPTPYYNTERLNRTDGPEDRSLLERCLGQPFPDLTGFRRIVQGPGFVSIYYDVGQGQGWERVIPTTGGAHAPSAIRQWWGDSRGHWEGNTLVVDVTNFSPKVEFRGAHENLHLIERWTRVAPGTLQYAVTIDDPTTWTKPWTLKHEMVKQDEAANRVYTEPRCHEGNFGMAGMLANTRAEELAFSEGRGPDPASRDNATGGPGGGEENADSLAGGGE